MFTLRWTLEANRTYLDLKRRSENGTEPRKGVFKQVAKAIALLAANPRHPGLRTHVYTSLAHPYDKREKVFEAYAQNRTPGAYRIFWCHGPEEREITIIAITRHP